MKAKYLICILTVFLGLMGCSSMSKVLNPYEDEFNCPYTDEGMCTSVKNAYNKSFEVDPDSEEEVCPDGNCDKAFRENNIADETAGQEPAEENVQKKKSDVKPAPQPRASAKAVYQEKKYEILAGLIQEEEPPIVVPPEVVRVLVLSYTGAKNEMFGFRYAYFFGTQPEWMLSTAFEGRN